MAKDENPESAEEAEIGEAGGLPSPDADQEMINRRPLKFIASDLWRRNQGREAKIRPLRPISTGEIVSGLDQRERIFGAAATVIAGGLAALGYFAQRASTIKTTREAAGTFLITMLIAAVLLLIGTAMRRRALLGFAAFLVGLEQLSYKFLPGAVIFFAFGGWLVYRVMQKNKQDRENGVVPRRGGRRPAATPPTDSRPTRAPKASKRYTPPKRVPSGRGR